MEAKELRIGNYVLINRAFGMSKKKEQVKKISINYISQLERNNNGYIQPIPLTEEWLIKFGFDDKLLKRIGSTDLYLQADCKELLKEYGVYLSTDIGDGLCSDPDTFLEGYFYVHQLQNLYFALTGEELTIKE
jgi:hypothetical protein